MAVGGLDILRGYELSWLNLKGRPEIACLEICLLPATGKKLDTFALKEFCNSLAAQKFSDAAAVYAKIAEYLTLSLGTMPDRFNMLTVADFYNADLSLHSTAKNYFLSNNVRFICEQTQQPCMGSLLIDYSAAKNNAMQVNLELPKKLLELRNVVTNPQDYAMQVMQHNAVLSLHLARKGGFSWQILRTHDVECDLWPYVHRSTVE